VATAAPVRAGGEEEDLGALATLVEAGTLRPVIDTTYPLSETTAALA